MGIWSDLGKGWVQVGKAVLNIAVSTLRQAKAEIGKRAREHVFNPLARRRRDEARQRAERRQEDIDAEMVEIYKQAQRDGWNDSMVERFQKLVDDAKAISKDYGAREPAGIEEDDLEGVVIDPTKIHILEWHAGQFAIKSCSKCNMPMRLQWRNDQRLSPMPTFFWGCTGFFNPVGLQCRNTEPVTKSDMGALVRKDNEAFAMTRNEINLIANSEGTRKNIGRDLRELQNLSFDAYRCPIHNRAMTLQRKKEPSGPLDVWYMKCPSIDPKLGPWGCGQIVKIKSVAQVLAVRELGTGRIF